MVAEVAGKSVELVDDDVSDRAVLGEAREHLLKLRSIRCSGGFAAIYVLPDQYPTVVRDESLADLQLSLKRVATLRLLL